jgi:hypothetical protein
MRQQTVDRLYSPSVATILQLFKQYHILTCSTVSILCYLQTREQWSNRYGPLSVRRIDSGLERVKVSD